MFLIITAVFPPEPVVSAKLSYDLASELSLKHDVTVISPRPTRPYGFKFELTEAEHNFKHQILRSFVCPQSNQFGRLRESFSFGRESRRYIIENHGKINVIYLNTWPLFGQYYVVRAAKRFNIPVIIHIQDIYPESLTKKPPLLGSLIRVFLLPIDKYVLKNSTKIIAISTKMSDYLIKTRWLDKSKVHVIQNWQDETAFTMCDEYKKDDRGSNEPFTFMYLGNIGPVAGVELLICAFANAGLDGCRLVIAGSGSMREDAIRRVQKNQEARIEFWDVPDGKVAEIQAKADVLLLPVRKGISISSIPSKLPAYMFSAKPIIASVERGSDAANMILNSGCGWVVSPDDEMELASTMREVKALPGTTLAKLGELGRSYALQHLSKKENLEKLVQTIKNAIN